MSQSAQSTDKVCPKCKGVFSGDSLYCPDDGTPLNIGTLLGGDAVLMDPYLGQVIHGDIEIRQLAGVGAMGRVYRAFQRGVDRLVAVKVLHRELSTNKEIVARFHREAHVASRLQHPHVVQVYLTGEMPDGAMYIVMEYLDGLSLQSALSAAGGALSLERALHVVLQLCDAVGEAHAQGVVHRDLKPENVMLVCRAQDDDYVKVLDFGIARVNWGDQSMATQQGLIFGTARYISPEGAQGEAVGPESDVYAIATLLFQMLAGETPFDGDQAVGILIRQIGDPPPPLTSKPRAANVPEPIARVVMKNLAKAKAERAPDARALGRMLLDAIRESGLRVEDLLMRPSLLGPRPAEDGKHVPILPAHTAPLPKMQDARPAPANLPSATAKWIPDGARGATPEPPRVSPVPADAPFGRPSLERASSQVLPTVVGAANAVDRGAPFQGAPEHLDYHAEPSPKSETMGSARRGRLVTVVTFVVCFAISILGAGLTAQKYGLLGPKRVVVSPPPTGVTPTNVPSAAASSSGPEMISLPPLAGSSTGLVPAPTDTPKINLTLEGSPAAPGVGQTVLLTGKVQASRRAKRLDSGLFVIRSGASPAVTIPAQQDANGFHASYMIPSLGPTVVTFSVRFDNFRAQTVRTFNVGGGTGDAVPNPTASVKWM